MKILRSILIAAALFAMSAPAALAVVTTVSRRAGTSAYKEISLIARSSSASCVENHCSIEWDPKPNAKLPPSVQKQVDDFARMKFLARKWRDASLTAEEKDELLRLFLVSELASD